MRPSYQFSLDPKRMPFVCQGKNRAGIMEGDGTLMEPTKERYIEGRQKHPSLQIAFQRKDVSIVMQQCQVIGHSR